MSDSIKETLRRLADEGMIIYDSDWGYNFRTENMDSYIPLLDEPNSSWGSTNVYSYWFNVRGDRFYGIFELAGRNVPDEVMEKMQNLTDILKPNDKRKSDFTYKRIFTTKWYDVSDSEDISRDAEKAVRSAVGDILAMEKNVFAQLKNE